ncbi:hypothetical protein [Parahaliea aestuarii]|uniref:Type 4 fimbrial biogenesis protein PilX N-terminal domain-containing protein n=1 Tax=Parahaliea aestuarii TaxID=1852021 RepID=A0A5C8ZQU2_9GAMM|nr:hypothetical protein [Parahaliea aestuarii]TXS90030.1 hypothetical protein FVW59_15620 [Parahaliea aestuarii]
MTGSFSPALYRPETGLVLPVALCFLLLLTLIAATASQNSSLELRLAANGEQQEVLRQQAIAVAQVVAEQPDLFTPGLAAGQQRCVTVGDCAVSALPLPDLLQETAVAASRVHIERIEAPAGGALALRTPEPAAFSATAFAFECFEVFTELDNSNQRGGRAVLAVGIGRRLGTGGGWQ